MRVDQARAKHPLEEFVQIADRVMAAGGLAFDDSLLDPELQLLIRDFLHQRFLAGAYLGLAEVDSPRRRVNFIENNFAELYSQMRSEAAPGKMFSDRGEIAVFREWAEYLFDVGYYAMRIGKEPRFRSM